MCKVITMTVFRRPHYLKQVLDALSCCVGIKEYTIVISIDPAPDPSVKDIIRAMLTKICFCKCIYSFNATRLGMNKNTHKALDSGFGLSNFIVHLDDDVLLGPDALQYYEYCDRKYRNDIKVFSVTGTNNNKCELADDYTKISRRQWFTSWGWGTWRDRWTEVGGANYSWGTDKRSWDSYLNRITRRERYEIYPLLARSKTIGEVGENTPSVNFFNKYCLISSWSGDQRWINNAKFRAREWLNVDQ